MQDKDFEIIMDILRQEKENVIREALELIAANQLVTAEHIESLSERVGLLEHPVHIEINVVDESSDYDPKEDELVHDIRLRTIQELLEHPEFVVFNEIGSSKDGRATVEDIMWGVWRNSD